MTVNRHRYMACMIMMAIIDSLEACPIHLSLRNPQKKLMSFRYICCIIDDSVWSKYPIGGGWNRTRFLVSRFGSIQNHLRRRPYPHVKGPSKFSSRSHTTSWWDRWKEDMPWLWWPFHCMGIHEPRCVVMWAVCLNPSFIGPIRVYPPILCTSWVVHADERVIREI